MSDIEKSAKIFIDLFDGAEDLVSQHGQEIKNQLESAVAEIIQHQTRNEKERELLKSALRRLETLAENEGYDKARGDKAEETLKKHFEKESEAEQAMCIIVGVLQHFYFHLQQILDEAKTS